MTQKKFRLPFRKRSRRRAFRRPEDPVEIFRTFAGVLARMHARGAAAPEKA